MNLGDN
jgi:hypothetical protein